jgi:HAD superfamily hydrolase (TIGR01509 family)
MPTSTSQRRRAAIFDVEGTLVDCVALTLESWRETLQAAGHCCTLRDLQPYSGMDGAWMLEQLLPKESATAREALLKTQGERYRADFIDKAQPFQGVRELIQTLKDQGVTIGIATTCKADELATYDKRLGVMDLADTIICGEMVRHGKPDPALFAQCLRKIGLTEASGAIAIGDTPFDALAAKAVGLRSAGVLTGGFSELALLDAGHERVFEEVRHVLCLWQGNGGH